MKENNRLLWPSERWFDANRKKLIYVFLILSLVLGVMSFNAKISEAHDDALYIEGGWRFVHEFPNYFYTQNAPLYPIFLAILIKCFGFHLILFKVFSVLFFLGSVYFTFRSFEKILPVPVFLSLIIFQSTNYLILYYSGMTFTESFFLFLQSLMFYLFRKWYDEKSLISSFPSEKWKWGVACGVLFFLISTCKSSAISVIPGFLTFVYFKYRKQTHNKVIFLKNSAILFGTYILVKGIYESLVRIIWNAPGQFSAQSRILLQKDPYDVTQGQEDLAGFLQRLSDNAQLYLSKRFFQIIGWMSEDSVDTSGFVTFLMSFLILSGLVISIRKSNVMFMFFGLYVFFQTVLSFVILQTRWDQARIILINMPVLIPLIFISLNHFLSKFYVGRLVIYFLLIVFSVSNLISGVKRAWKNYPVVMKNLKGDKYYGYTPDWINFLKCSEWCADSLPATSLVASRKAPMSFVYGKGKAFFPVYSVVKKDTATDQSNPDSALAYFRKNKVTHIMLPSLRINPQMPGIDAVQPNPQNPNDLTHIFYRQGVINTMHNILQPIYMKYPQKLKLVHKEGDMEECYLFEFQYDK